MRRFFGIIILLSILGLVNITKAQEVKINTNFAIEADGTLRMDGTATTFDDIVVPFTLSRQGSNNKPDFDYTNVGLLFLPNATTEIVYIIVQMPHGYKVGSDIYPHLHWQQTSSSFPTWQMDYKWFNNGEAIPAAWTSLTTNTGVFSYTSGNFAQISAFPAINGTGKGLSSVLLIKFFRNDAIAGSITAFQFDIHFEKDTQGSRTEYTK